MTMNHSSRPPRSIRPCRLGHPRTGQSSVVRPGYMASQVHDSRSTAPNTFESAFERVGQGYPSSAKEAERNSMDSTIRTLLIVILVLVIVGIVLNLIL